MRPPPVLVGRDDALSAARRLGCLASGSRSLVLRGETGIGKTALLATIAAELRDVDRLILIAAPAEVERALPFAALGDLLSPVLPEVRDAMPAPLAQALDVALMRAEPPLSGQSELAVSLATSDALARAAERRPLAIVVDDVQWLDQPSAAAITYAVRRLDDHDVVVVAAVRSTEPSPSADWLIGALPDPRSVIDLTPLPGDVLGECLHAHTGAWLPRETVETIHQATGGNPLFALEVARALLRSPTDRRPGEPLELPDSLRALVAARIEALSDVAREVLSYAGLLGRATVEQLAALTGGDTAAAALSEAARQHVAHEAHGRVVFEHPLFASSLVTAMSPVERRGADARLAELATDPLERARRHGLAADQSDEPVARELDEAAALARRRGAMLTAAELDELAAGLTPASDVESRGRRALAAAYCYEEANEWDSAVRLLEPAIAALPAGPLRAEALAELAQYFYPDNPRARAAAKQAAVEAEPGSPTSLRADTVLASILLDTGRLSEAEALLRSVVERGRAAGLATVRARMHIAVLGILRADPMARAAVDELSRLGSEVVAGVEITWFSGDTAVAMRALWLDADLAAARRALDALERRADDAADESSTFLFAWLRADADVRDGRLDAALASARSHARLVASADHREMADAMSLFPRVLVHAMRGDADVARRLGEQVVESEARWETVLYTTMARAALGQLELAAGRIGAAVDHLRAARTAFAAMGAHCPAAFWWFQGDLVEALLAAGDVTEARAVAAELRRDARRTRSPADVAVVRRSEGLLLAARGDVDRAVVKLRTAVDASPHELLRARALLALGVTERRARRKAAARDALRAAYDAFAAMPATLWAARARRELDRAVPARSQELSPTEERIVALVAAGRTNRQIAAELYVSVKTVEANLSRVYRKRGVSSRAQLAATAGRPTVRGGP